MFTSKLCLLKTISYYTCNLTYGCYGFVTFLSFFHYFYSFLFILLFHTYCSVENNVSCHFERTEGESRNLLLVDFSTSPPFLSSTEDTGAPVEMTVSLFYKALSYNKTK
jgi:hypothetical protein